MNRRSFLKGAATAAAGLAACDRPVNPAGWRPQTPAETARVAQGIPALPRARPRTNVDGSLQHLGDRDSSLSTLVAAMAKHLLSGHDAGRLGLASRKAPLAGLKLIGFPFAIVARGGRNVTTARRSPSVTARAKYSLFSVWPSIRRRRSSEVTHIPSGATPKEKKPRLEVAAMRASEGGHAIPLSPRRRRADRKQQATACQQPLGLGTPECLDVVLICRPCERREGEEGPAEAGTRPSVARTAVRANLHHR